MKHSLVHKKGLLTVCLGLLCASTGWSFTPSTQPPESSSVPGNVVLPLSVEFPTGLQVSYSSPEYVATTSYVGYFDNRKCYSLHWSSHPLLLCRPMEAVPIPLSGAATY